MAKVVVTSGYGFYGLSGGRMTSPDFTGWDAGAVLLDGSVQLAPFGMPASVFDLTKITLTGSALAITPDSPSGTGPDIADRLVSGTVDTFSFISGTSASHGSVNAQYIITGLSIGFNDLLAAGADPLTLLLAGNDEIIGSNSYDTLKGYDGNDTFLPGYSGTYPSDTYYDQIDGGAGSDTISYANMTLAVFVNLSDGTARIGDAAAPTAARMISVENATGGSGNDVLIGNDLQNILRGGAGNDVIMPGKTVPTSQTPLTGGHDLVDGGEGNDTVNFASLTDGVYVNLQQGIAVQSGNFVSGVTSVFADLISIENAVGGTNNDTLVGDTASNSLAGGAGNDTIFGGAGNDTLLGDAGNDHIYGGDGDDSLYGGDGDDDLRSDQGADLINGGDGFDSLSYLSSRAGVTVNLATGFGFGGEAQGDIVSGIELLQGSNFADTMVGSNAADTLYGNEGNDSISGGTGDDTIRGDRGNDVISGGNGNDIISGGADNDTIYGGAGNDTLIGEEGNDILRGDAGADTIDGGAGTDRVLYNNSASGVNIDLRWGTTSVGDTLINIENITGSAFNDELIANDANNNLLGGAGNDTIWGLGGNDRIEGQTGNDVLRGNDGNDGIGGGDGNDALFGDAGNDTLYGGNGNDQIDAGTGNDVVWGDDGDDYINAGAGNDFVVLGAGNDGFMLGAGDDHVRFDFGNGQDTIFDFGNGQDVIDFSATNVTLLGLQASATQTDAGVLFQDGSDSILLAGLTLSQLDWTSDFLFAG